MKRVTAVVAIVLASSLLAVQSAATRNADRDLQAIERTLGHYLEGHATGDAAVMSQAFHESARLQFITDGEYRTRTLEQYLGGLPGSPAADEDQRHRRIASVDYTGDAAVAKIELDYPGALITDYMQLLKIDGEWKIANKIFTVATR